MLSNCSVRRTIKGVHAIENISDAIPRHWHSLTNMKEQTGYGAELEKDVGLKLCYILPQQSITRLALEQDSKILLLRFKIWP